MDAVIPEDDDVEFKKMPAWRPVRDRKCCIGSKQWALGVMRV
jgi:hypothetical protein